MYQRTIKTNRSLPYNLLVASDLHLSDTSDIILDREFVSFLGSYAGKKISDKPWKLILAGDTFEFVGVTSIPSEEEASKLGITIGKEERKFGLKSSPNETIWKIDRIVKTHENIFRALTSFIKHGNKVVFISGNHDAELFWEDVREKVINILSSFLEEKGGVDIKTNIEFKPWADYEPGIYWIEHGSQYESYNSFLELSYLMP